MSANDMITFQNSGYFSKIIIDYLNQDEKVKPLFNLYPTLENFKEQISLKSNFSAHSRQILHTALINQSKDISISNSTQKNIDLLLNSTTYTITTGHQLNLFTGPLYFIYKIISVIKLTHELKVKYPESNFIPVYWMATEDHDFEEINHFELHNKKISWQHDNGGPVGELSTEGLDRVFEAFSNDIGISKNAAYLKDLFKKSYLEHKTLTEATRFLVNELFKDHGLVIIDGNDKLLKSLFSDSIKKELLEQTSFKAVSKTINQFNDYSVQVNPREINLFYIDKNLRERIIKEGNFYLVNNTEIRFTEEEIIQLTETNPEKFSPNVILRPLYQEIILPNLCYVGGGGELAYWLELKEMFTKFGIEFPMLLLRNSAVIVTEKQDKKRANLNLTYTDLFKKQTELLKIKSSELSDIDIDFSELKKTLELQFKTLENSVTKTDKSFKGAVEAQKTKQIKGLENLEKRLIKANIKHFNDHLNRITLLQNEIFPRQTLQERKTNFSEFYEMFGDVFLEKLFKELNPLEQCFNVVIY